MNINVTDQDLLNWGLVLISVSLAMGLGASAFVSISDKKLTLNSWLAKLILLLLTAIVVSVAGILIFWIYSLIKFGF